MRRFASHIGIGMLLLTLSGWGGALAKALCPHAGTNVPQAAAMMEDHACCLAKLEQTKTVHSGMHQHGATAAAAKPSCHSEDRSQVQNVVAPQGTCEHCAGRNESPTTTATVRELTSSQSGAGKLKATAARLPILLPAVSTQTFSPTQNAPPGQASRRHLLIRILLI